VNTLSEDNTMKTLANSMHAARHAAHENAVDHPARFTVGLVVTAVGAALWLVEVARMLGGTN